MSLSTFFSQGRYPWGIQRIVSTHKFPHNPKVPRSVQICIFKVPRSVQIHIFGGGGGECSRPTETQSTKICPNLHFQRGGGPDQLKPKVPRSVQIYIFGGGGPDQLKPKVPRSVQICIGGGCSRPTETQSAKISPNLHFERVGGWGWGVWGSRPTETQSAKICLNLHFQGWG